MMIQLSFSTRLGEMTLAQLEAYEEDLESGIRALKDSIVEVRGELELVRARIDAEYDAK